MKSYIEIEKAGMAVLAEQFGLVGSMPRSVKYADEAVLAAEARDLMPQESVTHWHLTESPPTGLSEVVPLEPEQARQQFLDRFKELFRA